MLVRCSSLLGRDSFGSRVEYILFRLVTLSVYIPVPLQAMVPRLEPKSIRSKRTIIFASLCADTVYLDQSFRGGCDVCAVVAIDHVPEKVRLEGLIGCTPDPSLRQHIHPTNRASLASNACSHLWTTPTSRADAELCNWHSHSRLGQWVKQ